MKQKSFTVMLGAILVLALAAGATILFRDVNRNKFSWQYTVTTDDEWLTLQNDGGSRTNVYYLIDFDKRQVQKCEDKYFGPMQKYDYKGKIIYEKGFDEQLAEKTKEVIEKTWDNAGSTAGTGSFYTIEKLSGDKRYVTSKNNISQLATAMEKFDQLP